MGGIKRGIARDALYRNFGCVRHSRRINRSDGLKLSAIGAREA